MTTPTRPVRNVILDTVSDLAGEFLYYGRKEDEYLRVGAIEAAVAAGEITWDEIVEVFRSHLPINDGETP